MNAIKIAGLIEYPIFYVGLLDMCKNIDEVDYLYNINRTEIRGFLQENTADLLFLCTRESILNEVNNNLKKLLMGLKHPRPVIFIDAEEKNPLQRYYEAGFRSLIVKTIDSLELSHAIKSIYRSGHYVSQELTAGFFNNLLNDKKELEKKDAWSALTAREIDVVQLIHREMSNHEIADRLGISPRTVEVHRANIARKLSVRGSVGIVKYAIQHEIWTI